MANSMGRGAHPVLLLWFWSSRPQWLKMTPGQIALGIQHPAAERGPRFRVQGLGLRSASGTPLQQQQPLCQNSMVLHDKWL